MKITFKYAGIMKSDISRVINMKKRMVLAIIFLLLTCFASAENHYVTQNGAGSMDGTTLGDAWPVADFNNGANWNSAANTDDKKIGPGDAVYFSGTITDEVSPAGSGTSNAYITLDGYEAGNADMHSYSCPQCAKISRQQLIGRYGIKIAGENYITVQDFEIEEVNEAILMNGGSSYLRVKRNLMHDTLDDCFEIAQSNNAVIGGSREDGNHFYDCGSGTGAADVVSDNADYVVVSYNWIEGGLKHDRGIDGVTLNSYSNNWLIEYNLIENHNDDVWEAPSPYEGTPSLQGYGENGVDIKHQCHDVVVRGNVIRGHHYEPGVVIHGRGYNVYIYGNEITDNSDGIYVFSNPGDLSTEQPSRNIHIWANVFNDNQGPAMSFEQSPAGGSDPTEPHHLFVYNNMFARNVLEPTSSVTSAVMWFAGASSYLRDLNNIFYDNRPTQSLKHHEVFTYGTWKTFDSDSNSEHAYNTYYDPGKTSYFRWYNSDGTYTSHDLAWVQSNTGLAENSYDRDPGMKDPEDDDFWAAGSSSSMVGSGADISDDLLPARMYFLDDNSVWVDFSYSVGLDKSTDWTTNPPTVVFSTRSPGAWDRGAYVFSGRTQAYRCTGTITANAAAYDSEESSNLAIDTPWTYSATDTTTKCQYQCSSGSNWDGSSCTQQQTQTKTYTVLKAQTPPVIDGNIDEFANANAITLASPYGTTGTFRFLWDSNAFYVAAEVHDSNLNANLSQQEDGDLYSDDSLEMMLDTLDNKGSHIQNDDYKFYVNVNNLLADSQAYDMGWDSGMIPAVVVTGTINNNADTDTGYTIEARIPWSGWASPSDNSVWGMNLALNDRPDTSTYPSDTEWSGSSTNIPNDEGELTFSSQFVTTSGSTCRNAADSDNDSVISISELIDYISHWKSGSVTISSLIDAISKWKGGC